MTTIKRLAENVPGALLNAVLALFYIKPRFDNYIVNLFFFVDILMNAFMAGNKNVTVSARVGYYADRYRNEESYKGEYWSFPEAVIDFTFYVMDGRNHCQQAKVAAVMLLAKLEQDNDPDIYEAPGFFLTGLMLIIILSCLIIAPILLIGKLFRLY